MILNNDEDTVTHLVKLGFTWAGSNNDFDTILESANDYCIQGFNGLDLYIDNKMFFFEKNPKNISMSYLILRGIVS